MISIDIFKKELPSYLRCDPFPLNFLLFNLFRIFCKRSFVDKGLGDEEKIVVGFDTHDDEEGEKVEVVQIFAIERKEPTKQTIEKESLF